MITNLLKILEEITARYGADIFDDRARLNALFADLAKYDPKAQKTAFVSALEHGFHTILRGAPKTERETAQKQLAQDLYDEEGLDLALCNDTLELLASVLFTGETEQPQDIKAENLEMAPCSENAALQAQDTVTNSEPQSEEIASLQKIITGKNEELIRCVQNIESITREKNQSDNEKQQKEDELNKTKTGLTWAIVLGILAVVISIGVGVSQYNNLMYEYNDLMDNTVGISQYNDLNGKYNTLQSEYNLLNAVSTDFERSKKAINITSIKVGNWGNGRWLTQPGGSLNARAIRYLSPVITYSSFINKYVTFYVRIIAPDGSVFRNTSISPAGYSYSSNGQVSRGTSQSFDLNGWGSEEGGAYYAGTWTIEVWYEGVRLASERVRLN
jgi:hypothetical protein